MKALSKYWIYIAVVVSLSFLSGSALGLIVSVQSQKPWTPTGISLENGRWLEIKAEGEAEITRRTFLGRHDYDYIVGPAGTYVYPDVAADKPFPLAAAESGPAPAYALIGKIGEDGEPFLVGERLSIEVSGSGELFMGINDYDFKDNSGSFTADIGVSETAPEVEETPSRPLLSPRGEGEAVEDACVVLLFVDGLRPDVMKEMTAAGYLPNIKKLFLDGGVEMPPTFTVFPSVTVPSSTSFLTGCSPARTGFKTQYYFDRKTRYGSTFFKAFGPRESANFLRPTGLRRILLHGRRLFTFSSRKRAELRRRLDGVKTVFDYMSDAGVPCTSGIVPVQPGFPSRRWTQRGMNTVPLLKMYRGIYYGDQINTAYALRHVFRDHFRAAVLWFPNVDVMGHCSPRGQFGGARRDLVRLDRDIGKIVERLKTIGKWDKTYLLFFSDHGHMGGESTINQRFDIAQELFYAPVRDADGDGRIDPDSGLEMNVKEYRYNRFHKWRFPRRYTYICSSDAVQHVYLPYASARSKISGRVNGHSQLTGYVLDKRYAPVDLIEHLLNYDLGSRNRYPGKVSDRPIDMVITRPDEDRILVSSGESGRAVIERKEGDGGEWLYRYIPVGNVRDEGGRVAYDASPDGPDPLGYMVDEGLRVAGDRLDWLTSFHGDREWLSATRDTRYPDGVVAIANSLFWNSEIRDREERNRPDMIICAARGWTIDNGRHVGTDHGYPFYESMRITFFVHGPNVIRCGALDGANRTVDILPTVLDIMGVEYDSAVVDGRPIRSFYEGAAVEVDGTMPDLYAEVPVSPEDIVSPFMAGYEVLPRPFTTYDLDRPYDPHILAADMVQIPAIEVLGIIDFLLDLVIPGDRIFPLGKAIRKGGDVHDRLPDGKAKKMSRHFLYSLLLDEIAISEASVALGGLPINGNNIDRAHHITDWFQKHLMAGDRHLAAKQGKAKSIPVHSHAHHGIDAVQSFLDGMLRELTADLVAPLDNGLYGAGRGLELIVRPFQKDVSK
ncbi:MAG: alkaline phosphatase family protein [Candidatus Tritonobacter lacicola]|nr:alkaline phosphatase family protein [Candidatus Tritonobacter lacicola]